MRGFSYLVVLAVALAGGTLALFPPASARISNRSDAADSRSLTQLRSEASRARERADALDREARDATQASERATIAAAALAARVEQAEAAVSAADTELAIVREQREALDRKLARERAPVAQLMAGLQTQVRRPPILTLLQPGSIQDTVHLRAVVSAVAPQIDARTSLLRRSLARSRELEASATRIAGDRRALQSDLMARRNQLAALSAAERLKARRAAGAADREAERAFAIGEQARDLSTLVSRIDADGRKRRAAADTPASVRSDEHRGTASSRFRLPVAGPLLQKARPGDQSVTVLAKPGALVVAPAAGRVAFAGPYRGYGQIVIIEHDGGWTSLVTGLDEARVAVGQSLVAGSPLGEAPPGNPQIGLELRRNGKRVNPLDQLR